MSDWISVDERLPENTGIDNLLCHMEGGHYMLLTYNDGFNCTTLGYRKSELKDVTHWQPLPDPPKGDSDE